MKTYEIRFANVGAASYVRRQLHRRGWLSERQPRSAVLVIHLPDKVHAAEDADRLCAQLRKEWDAGAR